MSNWQAGDLALCVRSVKPEATARTGIRQGGLYTVENVVIVPDGRVGLRFKGFTAGGKFKAFTAWGFRKITPGHEIEGVEVEKKIREPA